MNTGKPRREAERFNGMRLIAIIGICFGSGLLVFGQPTGILAQVGPPPASFWPLVAMASLVIGLVALTAGFNGKAGTADESTRDGRVDKSPYETIESRLLELMKLKEGKLISDEEYQRKRTEIIAKW
jgi:hypothetical protein